MWTEILRLAVGNGLWAVLFCCLLVYQLSDSRKREQKYQQTIESLRGSLVIVDRLRKDVELIKSAVTVRESGSEATQALPAKERPTQVQKNDAAIAPKQEKKGE